MKTPNIRYVIVLGFVSLFATLCPGGEATFFSGVLGLFVAFYLMVVLHVLLRIDLEHAEALRLIDEKYYRRRLEIITEQHCESMQKLIHDGPFVAPKLRGPRA